jgi:hypothetical protein
VLVKLTNTRSLSSGAVSMRCTRMLPSRVVR